MTAVRAAGYTAAGGANRGVFDPANLGQAGRGPAPPLAVASARRVVAAMEDLEDVITWVNSVLNEASNEGTTVDAKISSVSMKLQVMSADLCDELEQHMDELQPGHNVYAAAQNPAAA